MLYMTYRNVFFMRFFACFCVCEFFYTICLTIRGLVCE